MRREGGAGRECEHKHAPSTKWSASADAVRLHHCAALVFSRSENIKRLKSLTYLNLALNNITSISPELSHCEKLRKLDLTVNFIDVDALEASITALQPLIHLDELYLTGNPCTSFEAYKFYVIHRLPKLQKLDGTDVTRGDRIQAKTAFDGIAAELAVLAAAKRQEKGIAEEEKRSAEASSLDGKDDDDLEEEKETAESLKARASKVSAYTPEARIEMHREQEEIERKKAEDKKRSQRGDQPEDLWKEAQNKVRPNATGGGTAQIGSNEWHPILISSLTLDTLLLCVRTLR